MRHPILSILSILALGIGIFSATASQARAEDYPDVPVAYPTAEDYGTYDFPQTQPSFNPDHISDAIVSINVTGANFVDILMVLTQQAGVDFILDAYWNMLPSGHVREGYRPPGGPDTGGSSGFGGGSGFNPIDSSGGGTVTMTMTEVPFDNVFKYLMQAYNLDYIVFRDTPDANPLLYIGTRERLEMELGLGEITFYQTHYVDPIASINFLQTMDLLPTTSGYGYWYYGGGGNGSGGSGGGGSSGGGGFGSGGGSGGGSGFGGAGGTSSGLWTAPGGFAIIGLGEDELESRLII